MSKTITRNQAKKNYNKTSLLQKLAAGYYHSKLPCPTGNKDKNYFAQAKYHTDSEQLQKEFEKDMYKYFGLEFNNKKEIAYLMARDLGAGDFQKTFDILQKLVLLIK